MSTASVGLSLAVHPRFLALSQRRRHRDPLYWLSTPRVIAIALAIAIGSAAVWSLVFTVFVTLIVEASPTAILLAFLVDPRSSLDGYLVLTPVFAVLTLPTMLIWAIGALGTRRAIERIRSSDYQ